MNPVIAFNVALKQFTIHSQTSIIKLEWLAGASAASTLFCQIHDSNVTPAAGAVPIKSWPMNAGVQDYKEFKNGELVFANGCFVTTSTTDGTYTAGGVGDVFDMVAAEEWQPDYPTGTSFAGDLTTQQNHLLVWSNASGASAPKLLFNVYASDSGAILTTTRYLMLFADSGAVNGAYPQQVWTVAQLATLNLNFGRLGINPEGTTSNGVTIATGCIFYLSTTPTFLTTTTETVIIRAEYK